MSKFALRPAGGNLEDVIAGMTGVNAARNADLCEWGCRALGDFARAEDSNRLLVFDKGGVAALKYAAEKHTKHVGVQTNMCLALASLAACAEVRVQARDDGLLLHTVSLLDALAHSANVCQAACTAVAALAVDEETRDALGEMLAPAELAGAMLAFPDDVSLQQAACQAAVALSKRHDGNRAVLLEQGLIAALSQILTKHLTVAAMTQAACEAIEALCVTSDSRQQLHSLGVAGQLVMAMAQFAAVPLALQAVFRATARLAQHEDPRHVFLALGVMDIIVRSMQTQRTHLDVQLYACWALLELASGDDEHAGLPEVEVVDAIVAAMRRHVRNANVIQYGCIALENLATRSDESRVHIASSDGCKLVLSGLRMHMASETVARAALRALAVLAADDAKMHEHLTQIGGVTLTVELMKQHNANSTIVASGCRCLANLAPHARVRDVMDQEAVVTALTDAWLAHPTAIDVAVFAACALEHLAEEALRRVKFADQASKLALDAMAAHERDEDLQIACIRLLLCLARTMNDRIAASPGFIAAITVAMAAHTETKDLTSVAAAVLAVLSENAENRASIRKHGGIRLVLQAMGSYPGDEAIQQYGCSVLGNLAFKTGKERKPCAPIAAAEPATVIAAMRTHPSSPALAARAAATLRNICCHDLGREYAVRGGAIAELLAACDRFLSDEGVLFPACAALNNIAKDRDLKSLITLTGLRTLVAKIRAAHEPASMASRAAEELLQRRGMGGAP